MWLRSVAYISIQMWSVFMFLLSAASVRIVDGAVLNIHACTVDFCRGYTETMGCEHLAAPCVAQNRTHNGVVFRSPTPCGCCESCLANLREGDDCSIGHPGAPSPSSMCGDGLYCTIKHGNQHPTCEQMLATSVCAQARRKFDDDLREGLVGHLQRRPACDGDGEYGAVVCNPGQNCFCVNERGERIFGDALHASNIALIMHCGCSRLNDKLRGLIEQRFPFFTTRCRADGSFDALQCFGDLCLCVDPCTASPTSDVKNLTVAAAAGLRALPCYDETVHLDGFNYARPCENIKRGLINTIFEARRDGLVEAETHVDICDPDGSFRPVQRSELSTFCVDRDGHRIGEFVVPSNSSEAASMHCKCARARLLLSAAGYLELPECCANGNYRSVACRRGFCHCVDDDGKQVSLEVIDMQRHTLPCIETECK